MADTTISQLTKGTPSGSHLLPYSTGSNTLGVPVSAIFQNTSVIKTTTTGGLDGLQLYTNKYVRKSYYFVQKSIQTTGTVPGPIPGDWTSIGYITPTGFGWGKEIRVYATHHISDSVNSVTYQLHDSFLSTSSTYKGWVQVPSTSNYNYAGKIDFSLEIRRTGTEVYDNIELRYRAINPSGYGTGLVNFAIEILGGGEFVETSGGGNDTTVPAGYLGNTFYQFPLRTYADNNYTSYQPSTKGLFLVQPGRVGINTISPATTLDVNGAIQFVSNTYNIDITKHLANVALDNSAVGGAIGQIINSLPTFGFLYACGATGTNEEGRYVMGMFFKPTFTSSTFFHQIGANVYGINTNSQGTMSVSNYTTLANVRIYVVKFNQPNGT